MFFCGVTLVSAMHRPSWFAVAAVIVYLVATLAFVIHEERRIRELENRLAHAADLLDECARELTPSK